jgi:Spy/CpxP family protein refolding chaperone
MTTLKTVTIAAALLAGGASLAMAPAVLMAGGIRVTDMAMGTRQLRSTITRLQHTATQLQPRSTITQPQHTATLLRLIRHRPRRERPLLS